MSSGWQAKRRMRERADTGRDYKASAPKGKAGVPGENARPRYCGSASAASSSAWRAAR